MSDQKRWRNRIVSHGEVDPNELIENPFNWRIHTELQSRAVEGALDEVGWVDEVIVNVNTGRIVDGHLRVTLALKHNEPTAPVRYVDLSEEEEQYVLATLDPLGALAETDAQQLNTLLHNVNTGEDAIQEMLSNLAEEAGLLDVATGADTEKAEADDAVVYEQAIQLKPQKEYMLIVCDSEEQFEALKQMFGLRIVRRGGYKPGGTYDARSLERVITFDRFMGAVDR